MSTLRMRFEEAHIYKSAAAEEEFHRRAAATGEGRVSGKQFGVVACTRG